MAERVRFHFDPLCPWAWQTSKWMRAVEQVRDVGVEWRLFSLRLTNDPDGNPLADPGVKGTTALRTLALVGRRHGSDAVGRLYRSLGERVHERGEPQTSTTLEGALDDAGLDRSLVAMALADDETVTEVRADHDAAVAEVGCFGVPTIVLDSGKGIFGPVVAQAPTGEAAGELWDHVRWLAEQDGFFELKRERDRGPGEQP
jgi:predicted DsbA family dithiol-disulfide isomerase